MGHGWHIVATPEAGRAVNGGYVDDLGGARVCRGAWRYAPLPQREVGNLALQRRSRFCRVAALHVVEGAKPLHLQRRRRICRHAMAIRAAQPQSNAVATCSRTAAKKHITHLGFASARWPGDYSTMMKVTTHSSAPELHLAVAHPRQLDARLRDDGRSP